MTDDAQERELREFFQRHIVGAAESLRARDVSFFALRPDPSATSYWNTRPRGEGYVFAIGDDLATELRELWRDIPELQALADDLAAMTRTLADRREESADVSSFIYAMF
ncbi:MAG TPA: hypothetical protein VJ650_12065 [Gemmatimonadaceae bacterium]|nr:hypothetical protein [Gemmatimonadaceae bacterium]